MRDGKKMKYLHCLEISIEDATELPMKENTTELQWIKDFWDHGNLFEILILRATDG